MYSAAVFTRGRPLCTQILPRQGRPPSTILDIRILHPSAFPLLTLYQSVTDRQTDGRIFRTSSRASFAERCYLPAFCGLEVAVKRMGLDK